MVREGGKPGREDNRLFRKRGWSLSSSRNPFTTCSWLGTLAVASHLGSGDVARQSVLMGREEANQARWGQVVTRGALRFRCSRRASSHGRSRKLTSSPDSTVQSQDRDRGQDSKSTVEVPLM